MNNDQAKNLRELMKMESSCKSIFFLSGRCAVGKTTVITNLAALLSKNNYKTLVIDSGTGFFRTDLLLDVTPKYVSLEILNHYSLNDFRVRVGDNLDILYMRQVFESIRDDLDETHKIREYLEELREDYDFILFDLEQDSSLKKDFFDKDSRLIFVMSAQNLKCLKPTYSLIKDIESKLSLKDIAIVVNKVDNKELSREVSERIETACDKFLSLSVKNIGEIKLSEMITESFKRQTPVTVLDERCEVSEDFRDLFSNIILNEKE